MKNQIDTNNLFLTKHATEVQHVLEEHREALIAERDREYDNLRRHQEEWRKELQLVQEKCNLLSPVLTLNIGGTKSVQVSKGLMTSIPGSFLEKTFSGYHQHTKLNDHIFIDRDGPTFEHLINYLRHKRSYVPTFQNKNEEELFYAELSFWGIDPGLFGLDYEENKLIDKLPKKIMDIIKEQPKDLSTSALSTWKVLGPLKFHEIVE